MSKRIGPSPSGSKFIRDTMGPMNSRSIGTRSRTGSASVESCIIAKSLGGLDIGSLQKVRSKNSAFRQK
jgi:hypothetical protein